MSQGAWLTTEGDLLCTDTYNANVSESPFGMLLRDGLGCPCNSVYYIFEQTHMETMRNIDARGEPVTLVHYVTELRYCDADTPGRSVPAPRTVTGWVKKNIKALCGDNAAHAAKWKKWMEG